MKTSWEPIEQIARGVRSGQVKARANVERALQAIKDTADYNAVITVDEAGALAKADAIDENPDKAGRLAGVPFVAKDNYLSKGLETTAGSNILKGYLPPYDATVIANLEAEGAILVGKANLDAFAHGSSTENSDFGPTLNPRDKTRVPGGSSGGSAAAVALGQVPFALGSDTGGSIRLPASYCGVVGLKPTYGLVSRWGVVAMASSTDCMGPLTNTVEDAAYVLDIMAGIDGHDSTMIERDDSYQLEQLDLRGLRFGLITEHMAEGVDKEVASAVSAAADKLRKAGAEVKEVSLPSIGLSLAVYYIIVPAEVSSNLSRYDGVRYGPRESADNLQDLYLQTRGKGFNEENIRRIMIGTHVLSSGYYDAYYKQAQTVRTKLIAEFDQAFAGCDALIGPVAPTTAFKLGANTDDPLKMYLSDIMTVAANLVGNPAIAVPLPVGGMPIGLQIMAPQRQDRRLLSLAAKVQEACHAD